MDCDASEYEHSVANLCGLLKNSKENLLQFENDLSTGSFGMVIQTSENKNFYFGLEVFEGDEQTETFKKKIQINSFVLIFVRVFDLVKI